MPATVRYDAQYCPIARALDVLGDRWTLLILRELVMTDQRFSDLRRHLPGIASTLLTQRLQVMTEQDLVTTRALPAPSTRSVYAVTERGRSAIPVMRALAAWGMPLLDEPAAGQVVRPWTAVHAGIATGYDPGAAAGIDERYRLVVDGEELTLSSVRGGGPDRPADLVVETSARTLIDLRQGRLTMADAIATSRITCTGPAAALRNFQSIFRLA